MKAEYSLPNLGFQHPITDKRFQVEQTALVKEGTVLPQREEIANKDRSDQITHYVLPGRIFNEMTASAPGLTSKSINKPNLTEQTDNFQPI